MSSAAGVVGVHPTSGQVSDYDEISVYNVLQEDLDGDGQPDVTTIESSFITERDRVLVYDRAGDMEISENWQQATDFENDLWVFDAAADGLAELVIDFSRTETGALEARLWDDQDGDGTVRYQRPPNTAVQESQTPNVTVVARDGWWIRDEMINFNLDLTVDGPIQASFSSKSFLTNLSTDGSPDFTIQVRDTDEDGRPDYHWIDAWPDARSGLGTRRTEIAVNPFDDEPPITGSIFWPFLGGTLDWDDLRTDRPIRFPEARLQIKGPSGYQKFYHVSMPPIQVLWHKASLLYVGEFVTGRFNDGNWFTYSIRRVRPGETSPVNFEAPFAFYDLAADDDGYPELAIRFEQYLKRDRFPFREMNPEPVQIIRYAWDQDNNTAWDYKLGLIGRHPIDEEVAVGDLTLQTIPPSVLPNWVVKNNWDGATFVAGEDDERWTSEGIYEWGPDGYWRDEYVTGMSSARPSIEDLDELVVGQRGEYAFDLHSQPRLYLSPVDRKLHLLGAEGGVWRIDETREIHYSNLGGDFLNQWTLLEDGVPVKSMYFISDYIIYGDEGSVQIIRTDQPPALFTTSPPTDNRERLALGRRLAPYQHDSALPWDFESLLTGIGDRRIRVEGASLQHLSVTRTGFRFTIDLKPGFYATKAPDLNLSEHTPGAYAVDYDGAFHVMPSTPANLVLSLRIAPSVNVLADTPSRVLVEAQSVGLESIENVFIVVQAQQGRTALEIARQQIPVLPDEPTQVSLNWTPETAGSWNLQARLEDSAGKIITVDQIPVDVSRGAANPHRILLLSTGGAWELLSVAIVLLAFVIGLVGALLMILTQKPHSVDHR